MRDSKKYPECEKLAVERERQLAIQGFLEWLGQEGLILAYWPEGSHTLCSSSRKTNDLILGYLKIDQDRLEKERRAMLNSLREMDGNTPPSGSC